MPTPPTTIVDVLNTEVERINERKTAIDNAEEERTRIIALTSSATERQRAYNTMYAVIVAMLLGVVIIKMLYRFEFVPDFILDILIAAVVSVGLIYSLLLYSDIMRRNNMDFGQIDFGDAPAKTQAQIDKEFKDKIESGNLGGIASENDGKCNSAETIYNKKYGVCYPKTIPANKVPVAGTTDNTVKFGSVDNIDVAVAAAGELQAVTTDVAKTYLTDSAKYQYIRKKNGSYDWLPVGDKNIELDTTTSTPVIRRVISTDPNYVTTGRTAYVAETLSTYPVGQRPIDSFTTLEQNDEASVAPFSSNNLYAKYI
jgi:hypothetical protein